MYSTYFNFDNLSLAIIALVCFIGICVASFSARYLKGDRAQGNFYIFLWLMILSVCTMVSTNHLLIMLISWACSNYLLTRLMLHKSSWNAAVNSAKLAKRNFIFGTSLLSAAFVLLYLETGHTSIVSINNSELSAIAGITVGICIVLAAMTQSGILPFHRWLISSLNSPTPVSAIMHAGLVNGGGFLLARFAPLFLNQGILLNTIFTVGIISAIVGIIWKLMQNDVKRTLACSTVSQMGYMIAQCGLGLFPAAIAHLCWHGLFKAYLFLASGTAAQESRFVPDKPPTALHLLTAALCGFLGTHVFALTTGLNILSGDTTIFIFFVTFISGTQLALTIVSQKILAKYSIAIIATALAGYAYGLSVNLFEHIIAPLNIYQPQSINILHITAMILLTGMWSTVHLTSKQKGFVYPRWLLALYVKMLNASQPHPKTVTAYRNAYQF